MKLFNVLVLMQLSSFCLAADQANSSFNILETLVHVGQGVVNFTSNILSSPENLIEMGKKLLVDYPMSLAYSAINDFCAAAVATNLVKPRETPDISKMSFQLRTACERFNFPLLEVNQIWLNPYFDANKKVVILATGWTTTVNGSETIDEFAKAFNCRGGYNFLAVDSADYVRTLYSWSAFNTKEIGEVIGKSLVELANIVPVENIHLIGHSLGAHIVGAAARIFRYLTGTYMPHVTALDPARPCFNDGENLSGLQRGDAKFIDVIHSNPGGLGKLEDVGDADFYPNGMEPVPPGCLTAHCAHERAWQYYVETIYPYNEYNFMAGRCNSLSSLREGKCPDPPIPMGFAVPHNAKGNYFLEVNSESPFGMNSNKEREAMYEKCGLC